MLLLLSVASISFYYYTYLKSRLPFKRESLPDYSLPWGEGERQGWGVILLMLRLLSSSCVCCSRSWIVCVWSCNVDKSIAASSRVCLVVYKWRMVYVCVFFFSLYMYVSR